MPTTTMARPAEMDMLKFSSHIAEMAKPFVREALVGEVAQTGAAAWTEEVQRNIGALLSDHAALNSTTSPRLERLLQESLKSQLMPDEAEIERSSSQAGTVMAAAWVQFSVLALRGKTELALSADLLPHMRTVSDELRKALRASLNSLVIGVDRAPKIMEAFANKYVRPNKGVRLPARLIVDLRAGDSPY